MASGIRIRPSISIDMQSQTSSPASPSALFHDPISPNSWTARSFTTLQPSDSPSQAQFPKHSHASLLLKTRTTQSRPTHESHHQPTTKTQEQRGCFLARNFRFIALTALFHLSLIVTTAMVVLIITSATSKPRKRIQPGYYIGVILSFASGLASIIAGYVKWQERKTRPSTTNAVAEVPHHHHSIHAMERGPPSFALVPHSPIDDLQAVVNGGDPALGSHNHHLRALMASRNTLPSASARIAGSTNKPRTTIAANGIELESLHHHRHPHPPPQQEEHHTIPTTANDATLELRRFLDHELQRQEIIKRRISTWLRSLPLPLSTSPCPLPPQLSLPPRHTPPPPPPLAHHPHPLPLPPSDISITRIPANPARLAAIEAEISAYLGATPPPLPISEEHRRGLGIGISMEGLPEVRLREEAGRGRDRSRNRNREGVWSDPVTVVYVGPVREGEVGDRVGEEGDGDGEKEEKREEEEEVDDFAEKWIQDVVKGVDVASSSASASASNLRPPPLGADRQAGVVAQLSEVRTAGWSS